MVVNIPANVQHQLGVSITDDGHNTSLRRVLIPKFQRTTRMVPDTTTPTTLARNIVFLTVIAIINLRQKLQIRTAGPSMPRVYCLVGNSESVDRTQPTDAV